jgi:hypothetical protein
MSTDPKHGTSYCHICLKEVGGGESGRWQHVRSPAHLSYYLWSQNEEKRFGKSWYQCKSEAKAWADKLWQNSGQRAPSLGREDGKKKRNRGMRRLLQCQGLTSRSGIRKIHQAEEAAMLVQVVAAKAAMMP